MGGYDPIGYGEVHAPEVNSVNLKNMLMESLKFCNEQWDGAVKEHGFDSSQAEYWDGRIAQLQMVHAHFFGGTTDDFDTPGFEPFHWLKDGSDGNA